MAKLTLKKAATDVTVYLFAQDSSKTTGVGLTGLAYNTASLTAYYVRPLGSASAITLATQTVTGAHSDGGFVEIDATNMPGVYRLDLPDAVCATGVPSAVVMLKGATNLAPIVLEIQLTDFDVLDKLNVSSVEFVTSVVGSTITILRGDTLTASLLNLGSMESYVSLDFTVKASTHQSDDAALIRVRKNASGLTDGLLRLNGTAHTTGTDGSITINDAPTGDITIMLKATVTDDLVPGTYVYDIQLIEAAEVTTLTTGTLIVSADVTRLVA